MESYGFDAYHQVTSVHYSMALFLYQYNPEYIVKHKGSTGMPSDHARNLLKKPVSTHGIHTMLNRADLKSGF